MAKRIVLGISVLALFFFAAGCAGRWGARQATSAKSIADTEGLATAEQQEAAIKGMEIRPRNCMASPANLQRAEEKAVFETVYFDFDKSEIRPEARIILEKIALYLRKYRKVKVSFEGHCDERGTSEYNMAPRGTPEYFRPALPGCPGNCSGKAGNGQLRRRDTA